MKGVHDVSLDLVMGRKGDGQMEIRILFFGKWTAFFKRFFHRFNDFLKMGNIFTRRSLCRKVGIPCLNRLSYLDQLENGIAIFF